MPTVLVVDDDDSVREYMARVLEDQGYRVLLASNGLEALHLVARHSPAIHLVVSDVLMPIMSGPELAACLAEQPRAPAVRVRIRRPRSNRRVRSSITQPLVPAELCEMVRRTLTPESAGASLLEPVG